MSFLDKMKSAVGNVITGGAARVTIDAMPQAAFPGDVLQLKLTVASAGAEVTSNGIFIDIRGIESILFPEGDDRRPSQEYTFDDCFQIAPAFVLAPNESRQWSGSITLPPNLQPSYNGKIAGHHWSLRGRAKVSGKDPDSGWKPFRLGIKF